MEQRIGKWCVAYAVYLVSKESEWVSAGLLVWLGYLAGWLTELNVIVITAHRLMWRKYEDTHTWTKQATLSHKQNNFEHQTSLKHALTWNDSEFGLYPKLQPKLQPKKLRHLFWLNEFSLEFLLLNFRI